MDLSNTVQKAYFDRGFAIATENGPPCANARQAVD